MTTTSGESGPPAEDRVVGLMEALETAVTEAKRARDRHVVRGLLPCGCSDESPYPCHDCTMQMAAERANRAADSCGQYQSGGTS